MPVMCKTRQKQGTDNIKSAEKGCHGRNTFATCVLAGEDGTLAKVCTATISVFGDRLLWAYDSALPLKFLVVTTKERIFHFMPSMQAKAHALQN